MRALLPVAMLAVPQVAKVVFGALNGVLLRMTFCPADFRLSFVWAHARVIKFAITDLALTRLVRADARQIAIALAIRSVWLASPTEPVKARPMIVRRAPDS